MKTGVYNNLVNKVQQKTSDWFEFTSMGSALPLLLLSITVQKTIYNTQTIKRWKPVKKQKQFSIRNDWEKRIEDKKL